MRCQWLLTILCIYILPNPPAVADLGGEICVVDFFRPIDRPLVAAIDSAFKNQAGVLVTHSAVPKNILDCSAEGAREIVIVGHSSQSAIQDEANLVWFRTANAQERENLLKTFLKSTGLRLAQLKSILRKQEDFDSPERHEYIQLKSKKKKAEAFLQNPNKPLFLPELVLPYVFEQLASDLKTKKSSGIEIVLKKIRIMACQPQKILNRYPEIESIRRDFGVEIDLAPANRFLSFFYGEDVVSMSKKWLRNSL